MRCGASAQSRVRFAVVECGGRRRRRSLEAGAGVSWRGFGAGGGGRYRALSNWVSVDMVDAMGS